jgi:hypothetical protein
MARTAPRPPGLVRWSVDHFVHRLERHVGWHRMPVPLGLAVLAVVRARLRRRNLFGTDELPSTEPDSAPPFEPRYLDARAPDGSHNDLDHPAMGMAGARFGRNVPHERTHPDPAPLEPSPRQVSRVLLTRDELVPATSVNALVAGWLQFMINDWFSHGEGPEDEPWRIRLAEDDPWPGDHLEIHRTRPDPTRPAGSRTPPTYRNTQTHWWDASQLYGNDREEQLERRSGEHGKLALDAEGRIPVPDDPSRDPSRQEGFWVGIAIWHELFRREHNSICERLRKAYPDWSDDDLFERARLINAALIAKIHTVEWTPAVISHPVTKIALRTNWWGLVGERVYRRFGRLSDRELLCGIPGGPRDHFGVPYSLTEEFVAVYRMHPLIPDEYTLRSAADDDVLREASFPDLAGPAGLGVLTEVATADLFYSFARQHPGVVQLHNFPRHLQRFELPDGRTIDLGAIDVLRSRELGVPRYNEFRRLLHLDPAPDFETLTANPRWARELREIYDGDIEAVDLLTGTYAEPLPAGFAFSDTAFRIFVLMASRRLNSDRFFTIDYRPEVYTRLGLDWIDDNSLRTVLLRHHPELARTLDGVVNAFEPWDQAGT